MSNHNFYHQPELLFEQIADGEDEIIMDEDDWAQLELNGFPEEMENLAKEEHHTKTEIVMKKAYARDKHE